MNAAGLQFFVRWWCEELVRALLEGAWHQVMIRTGTAQDSAFRRFTALVDATPCWPCSVSFEHPESNRRAFEQGETRTFGWRRALEIIGPKERDVYWGDES